MQKISEDLGFFQKILLPTLSFGVVIAGLIITFNNDNPWDSKHLIEMAMPIAFFIFLAFRLKTGLTGLANEVWDTGNSLIVHYKRQKFTIDYANIISIHQHPKFSRPRLLVIMQHDIGLGKCFQFIPLHSFLHKGEYQEHPLITALIYRVSMCKKTS